MLRTRVLVTLGLALVAVFAFADKKKATLPAYVVQAKTVLVMIDPNAGVPVEHPTVNRTAQDAVEKAFSQWGRIKPVLSAATADLIVVIRKGSGKIVQPTVGGVPTNDRPVIVQPTDGSIRIGVQQGRPPGTTGPDPQSTSPAPGTEVGNPNDTFEVYQGQQGQQGQTDDPLIGPPVWRYSGKNGLDAPKVQAVAEFRKAVEEAEKAQTQKKKP